MRTHTFMSLRRALSWRDPDDDEPGTIVPIGQYAERISARPDILCFDRDTVTPAIAAAVFAAWVCAGVWFASHDLVEVQSDFFERLPLKPMQHTDQIPARRTRPVSAAPLPTVSLPDPRQVHGKQQPALLQDIMRAPRQATPPVTAVKKAPPRQPSGDVFPAGGQAMTVDAMLDNIGGLKAGQRVKSTGVLAIAGGRCGRGSQCKTSAGIGYGAGHGSGFGGGAGGVDDLVGSLMGGDGGTALSLKKRGSLCMSAPQFVKGGACMLTSRPAFQSSADIARATGGEFNTENYDPIYENPFKETAQEPLSTFSIDVDNASYSNVRRFLTMGRMPPPDAVRIEEMVNYFSYDYPQPSGGHPFSITTETAVCPWEKSHTLVLIGLQGKRVVLEKLPPCNLVFLIDVSGSMQSFDKLPLLKSSFKLLARQLRKEDLVSIVVYAGAAGMVLGPTRGEHTERILSAIERLEAGGCTAGGEGIRLAYAVAEKNRLADGNNRVILATDGDFNVGVSSDGELVRLIEEKRKSGIFLSVLGFGTGNYKDAKMEKLADKGNGNYSYIDNILEAKKVLVKQLGATLFTIAKDVKIQVEFNPAAVAAYRLIGYENRVMAKEDFNDDTKDAGEIGAGHSVTALYEIVPAGTALNVAGVDSLKYQQTILRDDAVRSGELLTVKFRYKKPTGSASTLLQATLRNTRAEHASENLAFASAVAGCGMLLRGSKHTGGLTYDTVIKLAKTSMGDDHEGCRHEFVKLAQKAELMTSCIQGGN